MLYNKILILCPEKYSLFNSFSSTFREIAKDVTTFDVRTRISPGNKKFNSQVFRFPNSIRTKWEKVFLSKVNSLILEEFNRVKPEIVFVYNSEYLLPETCETIRKSSKLIFFLGDSPFYTPANNYYLSLLKYADLILSPDSFWMQQLNMLGIEATSFFIPSIEANSYFEIERDKINADIKETDILYVGSSYVNSWGYKKAMLMSQFTKFNFKLYGGSVWKRWMAYFPELQDKFILSEFIPTDKLNMMFNKAKLIPVDGNPGIINGIHIRTFEALGSGSLPLIEYRKDVPEIIFNGFGKDLPVIHNYSKAAEVASYYLSNENERKDLAVKMKEFVNTRYSLKNNADQIVEQLRSFQKDN